MAAPHTLMSLHVAAAEIIRMLKTLPNVNRCEVAVIGGLALWNHMPNGRTTEDIDFIMSMPTATIRRDQITQERVKKNLVKMHGSRFVQHVDQLFYKPLTGKDIRVDIFTSEPFPYLPGGCRLLPAIPAGSVPYISPLDLIVFKAYACALRPPIGGMGRVDASDAMRMLVQQAMAGPVILTPQQRATIRPVLHDLVRLTPRDMMWWRQNLGV